MAPRLHDESINSCIFPCTCASERAIGATAAKDGCAQDSSQIRKRKERSSSSSIIIINLHHDVYERRWSCTTLALQEGGWVAPVRPTRARCHSHKLVWGLTTGLWGTLPMVGGRVSERDMAFVEVALFGTTWHL